MAGRRLQLRVSFCCVIVVREARGSREIFASRRGMRKILHFRVAGQFAQKQPQPLVIPEPHRSAQESALLPAEKQQIPRATLPRFGMTIPLGILKLHHYTFSVVQPGRRRGPTLDQSIRLDLRA
jgi:hypothetical protein